MKMLATIGDNGEPMAAPSFCWLYCANCVTHLDVCTVYILLYLVSFLYFSDRMKVITASSKRCNKVCELFQQCMSEYRAEYSYNLANSRVNWAQIKQTKSSMCTEQYSAACKKRIGES